MGLWNNREEECTQKAQNRIRRSMYGDSFYKCINRVRSDGYEQLFDDEQNKRL